MKRSKPGRRWRRAVVAALQWGAARGDEMAAVSGQCVEAAVAAAARNSCCARVVVLRSRSWSMRGGRRHDDSIALWASVAAVPGMLGCVRAVRDALGESLAGTLADADGGGGLGRRFPCWGRHRGDISLRHRVLWVKTLFSFWTGDGGAFGVVPSLEASS
ncbi:unnamed protein product [Urochloa humidicola]